MRANQKRPFDRDLDRLAGEECRRRRRHTGLTLRLYRRLVHGREFSSKEGEVGHGRVRLELAGEGTVLEGGEKRFGMTYMRGVAPTMEGGERRTLLPTGL